MKADKIFKENIQEVLTHGTWDSDSRAHWPDGTVAASKFITQKFETYDIARGEFPIITARKIPWKSAIKEVLWIYQEQSNDLKVLREKFNIHWWDEWESKDVPNTIGNRYGYTVRKNHLITDLISNLKSNPYSRRHIMNLWDLNHLKSSDGLFPCAYETLWAVRGEYLDCTLVQRSSDYTAANHINKIQYVALQMMISQECGLRPGKFSHFVNNLHIYDRHIELSTMLLKNTNESKPQPILKLKQKGFWDVSISDFSLDDYEPEMEKTNIEIAI